MNTVTTSSAPVAPLSVSAQTIFARLLPGLRHPSREMQMALLSRNKETQQVALFSVKKSWSANQFPDDRAAVAAISFGYDAPKGPLV